MDVCVVEPIVIELRAVGSRGIDSTVKKRRLNKDTTTVGSRTKKNPKAKKRRKARKRSKDPRLKEMILSKVK